MTFEDKYKKLMDDYVGTIKTFNQKLLELLDQYPTVKGYVRVLPK